MNDALPATPSVGAVIVNRDRAGLLVDALRSAETARELARVYRAMAREYGP